MSDLLLYDQDSLFRGSDFTKEAMKFFRTVGHTATSSAEIVAKDVLYCIYSELNLPGIFGADDRIAFSHISSLSYLFSIGNEVFNKRSSTSVKYYAIEIDVSTQERTVTANTIASGFAKNNNSFLVILFRHEDMCAFSFTHPQTHCGSIYSDWFGNTSIADALLRLDIVNLSLNSSSDFFDDLTYMLARRYYIERVSKDYAHLEWLQQRDFLENNQDQEVLERCDFISEILFSHIKEYGDDYIEEPYLVVYQTETIDSSDFDFDMLELELDELVASADLDFFDDDAVDEEEIIDQYGRIIADEIPDNVLNDPVLLLKWLGEKEHTKGKDIEVEESNIDL